MKVKMKDMRSRYCPFVKGTCLTDECVHYQLEGRGTYQMIIPEDIAKEFNVENRNAEIGFKSASCRLWRN